MADVRSLLKNERAARRIQHKYASYSTTGSLLCTICHLQLKSDTLWDGHLRSPGHIMRAQKAVEQKEAEVLAQEAASRETTSKKRKASSDEDITRKRPKGINGTFTDPSDVSQEIVEARPNLPSPSVEIQIPSRPATPSKPIPEVHKRPDVDEDEWAAFEADIAAVAEPIVSSDAVISAPAISAAELAQKSVEETSAQRKERQEAELEGDKEDAARKMEEELDTMEGLEQRVKRLREKREELRKKESSIALKQPQIERPVVAQQEDPDEEEEYDEDEDEWDGFRMR